MTDPTAWTPDQQAADKLIQFLAQQHGISETDRDMIVTLAVQHHAALARIRALEAACEPFARCRWPLDLGSRCGECSGCALAALLARKETAGPVPRPG